MSDTTANLTMAGAVLLTGLSALLLLVGATSYARMRAPRLLWVSLAFAGFLVQGVYLTMLAYRDRGAVATGSAGALPVIITLDVVILALLYLAAVKR